MGTSCDYQETFYSTLNTKTAGVIPSLHSDKRYTVETLIFGHFLEVKNNLFPTARRRQATICENKGTQRLSLRQLDV